MDEIPLHCFRCDTDVAEEKTIRAFGKIRIHQSGGNGKYCGGTVLPAEVVPVLAEDTVSHTTDKVIQTQVEPPQT